MAEYIERESLVKTVQELFAAGDCYCDEYSIIGAINAAPAVSALPHWISVEEKLPEMHDAGMLKVLGIKQKSDKCILAITDGKAYVIDNDAWLRDGEWNSSLIRCFQKAGAKFAVTHWMPMPDPPIRLDLLERSAGDEPSNQ